MGNLKSDSEARTVHELKIWESSFCSVDVPKMAMGWPESMMRINSQILGNSSILKSRQRTRERQNRSDLRGRETEESRFIDIEREVSRRKNDQ